MARGHEKGVCCICVISLHLAFSLLMFHPCLLFLHTRFDITFLSTFLPNFPVLESQDTRHSAHASRSLATLPSQMETQVMSPTSSTRILPWMMTRRSSTIWTTISPTSRKPRTRTLANSVFSQCLNPLFCTFLMMILLFKLKVKKACNRETVARQRERRKRMFCDLSCRVDVKERSTERF